MARKSALSDLPLSPAGLEAVRAVESTRNPRALAFFVKAALAHRAALAGEADEYDLEADADRLERRVTEPKVRARVRRVVAAIQALTEPKDVSVLCAAAIDQRKKQRSKA